MEEQYNLIYIPVVLFFASLEIPFSNTTTKNCFFSCCHFGKSPDALRSEAVREMMTHRDDTHLQSVCKVKI